MPKRAILLAFEDFDSMEMWLKNIDARYNSVSLNRIGVSIENRTIYVVKINDALEDRPIILLEGGAHSREWIATSSVLYLIEKLASYTGVLGNSLYGLFLANSHHFSFVLKDKKSAGSELL